MSAVCPAGHTSTAADYCDVCGMPIDAAGAPPVSAPPAAAAPADIPADAATQGSGLQPCPSCQTPNPAEALFCEACGYDFTTGTMPRSAPLAPPEGLQPPDAPTTTPTADAGPPPAATGSTSGPDAPGATWVAEIWIDPAWYTEQDSPDPLPSAGLPTIVALRGRSVLVGRTSRSRNIHPEIDCEPDTGTSRRQAQLTSDGSRWWVEDLDSANGTFVGPASGPLPTDPVPVGQKVELDPDDRIYVGAWTRLVVREATEDELASLS